MSRFGPIPKPFEELKTARVTVWFSQIELDDLDRQRGHYSRSEWLRLSGLNKPAATPPTLVPPVNRAVWDEIKQGPMSNLHQMVKLTNQAELAMPGQGLKWLAGQFKELIALAEALRDRLTGAPSEIGLED